MSIWWRHQPKRAAWGKEKYWPIHWPWGGRPKKAWGPQRTAVASRAREYAFDRKHRYGRIPVDALERLTMWKVKMANLTYRCDDIKHSPE